MLSTVITELVKQETGSGTKSDTKSDQKSESKIETKNEKESETRSQTKGKIKVNTEIQHLVVDLEKPKIEYFEVGPIIVNKKPVEKRLGGIDLCSDEICKEVLLKTDLGKNKFLKKYVVSDCKKQTVNGFYYFMTLSPYKGYSKQQTDKYSITVFELTIYQEHGKNPEASLKSEIRLAGVETLSEGRSRQPVEICERIIEETNLNASYKYLENYNVVFCYVQKDSSSYTYEFELVNSSDSSLKTTIQISQSKTDKKFKTQKTNFDMKIPRTGDIMDGGYFEIKTDQCERIVSAIFKNYKEKPLDSKIIKCERQTVNGFNYKIQLQNKSTTTQLIQLQFYESSRGEEEVSSIQTIYDFVDRVQEIKGSFESQSDYNPCYKIIELTDKELSQFHNYVVSGCQTRNHSNGSSYKISLFEPHSKKTCEFLVEVSLYQVDYLVNETDKSSHCLQKLNQLN